MMFRSVVLPQPEGPMIIINSPGLTSRLKSLSANDSASPYPKLRVMFFNSIKSELSFLILPF